MIKREDLEWGPNDDQFTLKGLTFAEVQATELDANLRPGENCFHFYKQRPLVEQYLEYFGNVQGRFPSTNFVELGLFDGGSIPFWCELFEPDQYVGIDIRDKSNPPFLRKYIEQRGLEGRLAVHWNTDQSDAKRLHEICDASFGDAPIDLVIDDASHLYELSLATFEALFPRVRPGGHYIVEDWAWFHWPALKESFAGNVPLTRLITELVEATGSSNSRLIKQVDVRSGFVVVERGWMPAEQLENFRLADFIERHSD